MEIKSNEYRSLKVLIKISFLKILKGIKLKFN